MDFARPSREAAPSGAPGIGPLGGASIRDSVRSGIREARVRSGMAADVSRYYAELAAQAGAPGSRPYARDAVNATGRRIRRGAAKPAGAGPLWHGEDYVNEQPVRAVLLAAAGGALLSALIFALTRAGSRR